MLLRHQRDSPYVLPRSEFYGTFFFFQAEDGIRDLVRSRGLGDVYKRQALCYRCLRAAALGCRGAAETWLYSALRAVGQSSYCLLYTSDAADERSSVDLGGRRIIKKKQQQSLSGTRNMNHRADTQPTKQSNTHKDRPEK